MLKSNSCNGIIHVVKQGETLYSISKMHHVSLALILRSNPYVDVYNLQIGMQICVPVRPEVKPEKPEEKPDEKPEEKPEMEDMSDVIEFDAVLTYQVQSNMSLEDVLKANKMTMNDLMKYNQMKNIYLVEGTVIVVPKR